MNVEKMIELSEGQYTDLPDSAYVLVGPARVKVTRHGNGQLTAVVLEGKTEEKKWVVKRGAEKVGWGV